jgi:EAL and modified HD-GYP domain-containing signal transduction protein
MPAASGVFSLLQDKNSISVSFARQPVFDGKRRLWGYELFCVGNSESTPSGFPGENSVAIQVQSSAYMSLQQITGAGKKVIVDFSERSVLERLPYVLPPVLAAVKVPENVSRKPSVMESLARLKADGFLIVVGEFSGNAECALLYQLADILSIDIRTIESARLTALLAVAQSYTASLMAMRVYDPAQFQMCADTGFSLFHGPFFKSPDRMTVRKLSSNEVFRFNLLQFIETDDPDFGRLAAAIQADATISFRLLGYLNSAAFGFSQKIKTIQQAVALLGWRTVRNWLRVVLLTDMSQSKDAHELVLLSAQRGLFLELVARDHDFWGFDPEHLHLLGLFSLLDALLGMPMAEIVANLPLESKMKAALCRETHNEYLPLIQLVQCLEEARWDDSDRFIQQLNLDPAKIKAAFHTSVAWSSELESLQSEKSANN